MTEKYLSDEEVLQKFYSGITEEEARVAVNAINMFCRDKTSSYLLNSSENILPRPVIRDENGELLKDYTPRDFYLKLQEEIFEEFEDKEYVNHYEIADVITVCISYLNAIGYDEKGRSEIFAKVNEKNEKRGYFKKGGDIYDFQAREYFLCGVCGRHYRFGAKRRHAAFLRAARYCGIFEKYSSRSNSVEGISHLLRRKNFSPLFFFAQK